MAARPALIVPGMKDGVVVNRNIITTRLILVAVWVGRHARPAEIAERVVQNLYVVPPATKETV